MSLISFARACLRLRTLGYTVDADKRRVPVVHRLRLGGVVAWQEALTRLEVGRSKLMDPMAVAAFFSGLFLNLETIGCDLESEVYERYDSEVESDDGDMDWWGQTRKLRAATAYQRSWIDLETRWLPHFVMVRVQEQVWAYNKGARMLSSAQADVSLSKHYVAMHADAPSLLPHCVEWID